MDRLLRSELKGLDVYGFVVRHDDDDDDDDDDEINRLCKYPKN
jgi:hypothetical protein